MKTQINMKEEMTLREFIDAQMKECITKLVELEVIGNWLNAMYGIELDIKIKLAEKREGRFYGKGLIEKLDSK
jgi:hypothetical protein